jgi:hypothetical protein
LTGCFPATETTIHGNNVGVTHLLQIQGSQGGAEASATVQDNGSISVGDCRFNVSFNDSLAEMYGVGKMTGSEFTFLANVNQMKALATSTPIDHVLDVAFPDLRSNRINDVEKSGRVILGHCGYPFGGLTAENVKVRTEGNRSDLMAV